MNDFMKDGSLPRRTCDEWADLLALTSEEHLSSADRAAFMQHVHTCAVCTAMRADYRLITTYLRRSLTVTPLPSLPPPVLAEIQRDSSMVSGRRLARPTVSKNHLLMRSSTFLNEQREGLHHLLSVTRQLALVAILGLVIGVIVLPNLQPVQAASLFLHQSLQQTRPAGATWVHTVSWSPDGKFTAVLWDNNAMQVLDARTGKEIFSQEVGWGYGLAWSPDSQFLASAGREDNTIQIWNIATHSCKANMLQQCLTYTQHTALVEAIAWSPDGSSIASASDDGTVQVWDARTMKRLYRYQDSGSKVTSVAWSPDGKRLVSGDDNGRIQAWDAFTGKHLASYTGHTGAITSVNWSSDGNSIASSSYDGTARIWDVTTDTSDRLFNGSPVFAATWNPHYPTYLALACYDGSVQVWSITHWQGKEADQEVAAYPKGGGEQHNNGIFTISWSPQGDQLITGGQGYILYFKLGD